jgi:hypothetical protein
MVLTIENAGALVSGLKLKEGIVEAKRVKILRGFYDGKKSLQPGEIVNLPANLAYQAREAHKVEFLPNPPEEIKVPPVGMKAETQEEMKPEKLNPEPKEKHRKYGKE